MSFGFSPSDIITAINIVKTTWDGWHRACGEYADITITLNRYAILLDRVKDEATKENNVLVRHEKDAEDLKHILRGSRRTARALTAIIEKYDSLGSSRASNWERIRFGNKDLSGLRTRLQNHETAISAYLNIVGLSSLSLLGDMQRSIDALAAEFRAGRKESSVVSTMTNYEDDDGEVWKQFRRDLIGNGFTSATINVHESAIMEYLRSLARRGMLDESVPIDSSLPDPNGVPDDPQQTSDQDLKSVTCPDPDTKLPNPKTTTLERHITDNLASSEKNSTDIPETSESFGTLSETPSPRGKTMLSKQFYAAFALHVRGYQFDDLSTDFLVHQVLDQQDRDELRAVSNAWRGLLLLQPGIEKRSKGLVTEQRSWSAAEPELDPYEVLGVEKAADAAKIKTNYRKLVLKCHPDKAKSADRRIASYQFGWIQQAYEVLINEEARARYDAKITLAQLRKERMEQVNPSQPAKTADISSRRRFMESTRQAHPRRDRDPDVGRMSGSPSDDGWEGYPKANTRETRRNGSDYYQYDRPSRGRQRTRPEHRPPPLRTASSGERYEVIKDQTGKAAFIRRSRSNSSQHSASSPRERSEGKRYRSGSFDPAIAAPSPRYTYNDGEPNLYSSYNRPGSAPPVRRASSGEGYGVTRTADGRPAYVRRSSRRSSASSRGQPSPLERQQSSESIPSGEGRKRSMMYRRWSRSPSPLRSGPKESRPNSGAAPSPKFTTSATLPAHRRRSREDRERHRAERSEARKSLSDGHRRGAARETKLSDYGRPKTNDKARTTKLDPRRARVIANSEDDTESESDPDPLSSTGSLYMFDRTPERRRREADLYKEASEQASSSLRAQRRQPSQRSGVSDERRPSPRRSTNFMP